VEPGRRKQERLQERICHRREALDQSSAIIANGISKQSTTSSLPPPWSQSDKAERK